ncbi:hypothetical protein ES703_105360 [subsurface metagenome]
MAADDNDESTWKRRLVNLWQTAEQRKEKYWLCRSLGCNPSWAARYRDWRLSKIERRFSLNPASPTIPEHSMLGDKTTE